MIARSGFAIVFVALALSQLLVARFRRDRLTALVMDSTRGAAAHRLFRGAILLIAAGGALGIAIAPDDLLFPWLFGGLVMALPTVGLVFHTWQRRAVASLEETRAPQPATLDLSDDPIPRIVWLAAIPPIATGALVYWLQAHWSGLVLRDPPPLTASLPPWENPGLRSLVRILLVGVGWNAYLGLLALMMWHGTPRRHGFRRSQLHVAVALSWSQTLLWPAIFLPIWFQLPPLGLLLSAVSAAAGIGLLVMVAPGARRELQAADLPPSSYRMYFDRRDPSAFGDRGMNLGSPWIWVLVVAPITLVGVTLFLL